MDLIIPYSKGWTCEITPPASKSYSQRALLLSLVFDSQIKIYHIGNSQDEKAALSIISALNSLKLSDNSIEIEKKFDFNKDVSLNCDESGLLSRMVSMIFLHNEKSTTVLGQGSLLTRPLKSIEKFYQDHHIHFESNSGFLPLKILSRPDLLSTEIDGSFSSQYISGLLYYYVLKKSPKVIRLSIQNLVSRPYIDMTIDMLNQAGASIIWKNESTIDIQPYTSQKSTTIYIERDWSAAAVWIVAAAIGGDIVLNDMNIASLQADIAILDAVRNYGAKIQNIENKLTIKYEEQNSFDIDASHSPDLIPILTVLAFYASETSRIKGVNRLIHKESNRKKAIIQELTKVGGIVEEEEDTFLIRRNKDFSPSEIVELETYNDHRLVMAWSVLGLFLPYDIVVKDIESVKKSYPEFVQELKKII